MPVNSPLSEAALFLFSDLQMATVRTIWPSPLQAVYCLSEGDYRIRMPSVPNGSVGYSVGISSDFLMILSEFPSEMMVAFFTCGLAFSAFVEILAGIGCVGKWLGIRDDR